MKLGVLGVVLALGMVVAGLRLGIEAARVSPPEFRLYGLDSKQFMAVPVLSILVFGLLVLVGVVNRRRPEVHRPMMLMASVSVIGAALGRMAPLNALYAGTWWEVVLISDSLDRSRIKYLQDQWIKHRAAQKAAVSKRLLDVRVLEPLQRYAESLERETERKIATLGKRR